MTASAQPRAAQPASSSADTQRRRVDTRFRGILSLDDFERAARRRLPRPIFGYVSGGVEDGLSLDDNRRAFAEYGLLPRFLVGVAGRSAQATLFGRTYASPFGIAPMGIVALSGYRGDIALASAAAGAGIPMIISGSSLIPLETIAAAGDRPWFQIYLPPDLARTDALLDRVARAKIETLVVTVDVAVPGNRENNLRTGFSTPLRPTPRLAWDGLTRPRWLLGTFARTLVRHGMPHFENSFATRGAPIMSRNVEREFSGRAHLDWSVIRHIRARWQGPLVIKGLLDPADVRCAIEAGADGIIASNHGGRQLDSAVSPLRTLPAMVDAAGGRPVMLDGGIRRGTDVMKALALGARFVFVGRPFNYATAFGGHDGVAYAIRILHDEVVRTMGALGINALAQMTPDRLVPVPPR